MERHGEVGEECKAIDLEIVGKADRRDDGARSEIDQCACCDAAVLQVEVHVCLASRDDAKAMIVDDDGKQLQSPQRGLNIVRHADGKTKTVVVK